MATVDLGSIKFNWKNNWATSTAYAVDDVVFNNPDSYVCITAHTSHASDASLATSDSAYWNKMAAGGTDPADLDIVQGNFVATWVVKQPATAVLSNTWGTPTMSGSVVES